MFNKNINDNNSYKIGLYIRLSREDGDDLESESISNQRSLLSGYLKANNLVAVDEYVDDGFSGGNFDRPGFKQLIRDIEAKKINCVITKDLSRLGRDHIETGSYVERYFPEHNIRYIAVNDDIDTFYESSGSDMMPFRLSMNDMYAKDISKKVRSSLLTKKKEGQFCGSSPPYGYMRDSEDKHKLVPDPKTAPIVKQVFDLYINGYGSCAIAEILTREKVPTPVMIKCSEKAINKADHPEIWKHSSVNNILKNKVYTGCLIQHKVQNVSYKSKKRRKVPKSDWCIKENTHEAIVDIETYNLAQKIRNKSNNYSEDRRNIEYSLSNLVYCKDCGSSMAISYDKKRDRVTMNCTNYRKFSKYGICFSHYINYDKLEKTIYDKIGRITEQYKKDKEEFIKILKSEYIDPREELKNKIKSIKVQIENLKRKQDSLYDDKFNGVIDAQVYKRLFDNTQNEIDGLNERLVSYEKELSEINDGADSYEDYLQIVECFLDMESPTKDMLHRIIDKIYITEDKKVEIHYKIGKQANAC